MNGLKRPPFHSRFARGAVRVLSADVPLEIVGGNPVLPEILRWALSLNEGDLLIASASEGFESVEWKFACYLDRVEQAIETYSQPWRAIEEMVLSGRMAQVGRNGTLVLPREGAWDEPISLRAEDRLDSFLVAAKKSSERFFVEARYTLPLAAGPRVTLPAEALWALGLSPGDQLKGEAFLAELRVGPRLGYGKSIELELELGGVLRLPDFLSLLGEDKPEANAHLIVTLSPQPAFRITQWADAL